MKSFIMKHRKTLVLVMALMLIVAAGSAVAAESAAGGESDPIVTKSYVDSLINELKASQGTSSSTVTGDGAGETYQIVHLAANTRIIGGESTEMILRSGEATVWTDNEKGNGISDLTAGKDLTIGTKVQANHLILIPRADGRGISVWTDSYVMVKGKFSTRLVS